MLSEAEILEGQAKALTLTLNPTLNPTLTPTLISHPDPHADSHPGPDPDPDPDHTHRTLTEEQNRTESKDKHGQVSIKQYTCTSCNKQNTSTRHFVLL